MTETDKLYYRKMLKKGRLIPFFDKDELVCIISFYITNDPDRYIQRDNAWSVEEDEPGTGTVMLVDQIWSDKNRKNQFQIWRRLISFCKENYPLVNTVRWNRWKNEKLYKFNVLLKKEK